MRNTLKFCLAAAAVWLVGVSVWMARGASPDSFTWSTKQNRVSADIRSGDLLKTLERVAGATGWQIFLEPDTEHVVSTKFNNLPPAEALRMLLGGVSFALLPGTNTASKPRLFVFRTSRESATLLVSPSKPAETNLIANELIVRLKPGTKIDELARSLGAKVLGRIEGSNAYRLQFDDAAATTTARAQL